MFPWRQEDDPNPIHKDVAEEPAEILSESPCRLTRKPALRRKKRSVSTSYNQERHDSILQNQDVVAEEPDEILDIERQVNRMTFARNVESAAESNKNVFSGRQPKRVIATQNKEAGNEMEMLDITRLTCSPSAKRKKNLDTKARESLLDDSIANIDVQQPRKDHHIRRSLSMPSVLSPPQTKKMHNSRRLRSASAPRTFPKADYTMISQYQLDERRNYRQAYYEFRMLKKARKQELREQARRERMRQITCLKKMPPTPPKRVIRPRSPSPAQGACCAW